MSFPITVTAVVYNSENQLELQQVPMPIPQFNEVLVQVLDSPFEPVLLNFQDSIPGYQGMGYVDQSGGGAGDGLVGQCVGFIGKQAWSQFTTVSAQKCIVLPDIQEFNPALGFFLNKLSLQVILDSLSSSSGVIINGAETLLGDMLSRKLRELGIAVVNVVQKNNSKVQIQGDYTLSTEDENFELQLKNWGQELKLQQCFDIIGGKGAGRIINQMPPDSTLYLVSVGYEEDLDNIDPGSLRWTNKAIVGLPVPDIVNNWPNGKLLQLYEQEFNEEQTQDQVHIDYIIEKHQADKSKNYILIPNNQAQQKCELYIQHPTKQLNQNWLIFQSLSQVKIKF